MPDKNGSAQEPEKKRPFIREKVAKPPMTRRQMVFRMFAYVLLAAIAGIAAGVSFAVADPLAQRYLVPTTEAPTAPTVTIPTDMETPPEPTVIPETTTPPTTQETESESETETEPETEPLEDILQSAIEEYNYTVDDLDSMYTSLRSVVQAADSGVVVIHSVRQELDWFDNPIETAGLFAGVVIAATEQELKILTPAAAVENADSLKVTFSDNTEADCTVDQIDHITGMAVVSVELESLGELTRMRVDALPLGNSFIVKQGDMVIAVGAPSGAVHSVAYGFISHMVRNVQVADGLTRLLYADVTSDAEAGTFLINTAGEVIGWATGQYGSDGGMTTAMAISDYKTILEMLSNGIAVPYLGIQAQEVSEAMKESGMPAGVYVSECSLNGPAYDAGIQNGDIIVELGGESIETMSQYQARLQSFREGDSMTVMVQRRGADEYIELEYQVIVGAR